MAFIWTRKKPEPVVDTPLLASDEEATAGLEDDEFEEDESEEDVIEEEDLDVILERVWEWGRAWSESPLFTAMKQEQKDEAEYITSSFTEYMYNYHGVGPEDWNVSDLEECCLDTLPRKISADDVYFRSLAPVLSSFFSFLYRTGRLPNASFLDAHIRTLNKRIIAAAGDPSCWGMAKSLVMAAKAAGVDVSDQDQLNRFMLEYNERIAAQPQFWSSEVGNALPSPPPEHPAEPFERSGPKVGRNDPCPCGSGKKYKKCCGA